MDTVVAVVLFVIGAGALVASVLMDRRPARGKPAALAQGEARMEPEAGGAGPEAASPAEPEIATAAVTEDEIATPEAAPEPEPPMAALAPAPTPQSAEATAAEVRLARLRAELTGTPEPEASLAPPAEPASPPAAEQPPGAGHTHAVPLVNHSDLVRHMRREHADLESNGSTIQMRLLHERAHASAG